VIDVGGRNPPEAERAPRHIIATTGDTKISPIISSEFWGIYNASARVSMASKRSVEL
jgi:hypothetical protein